MNAIVKSVSGGAIARPELVRVLGSSLYPGAAPASIELVLGYCDAAGLDPMQKPVHIVPMRVKSGQKNAYGDDIYEQRDTVMPGISLYRVQATRSGAYVGQDEPEFGPMVEFTFDKKVTEWITVPGRDKRQPKVEIVPTTIRVPEWCRVTVYRIVGGQRCAFTAVEYWQENYATAGRDSLAPNEMWERRSRGQLVKCTEAQALRKAFPDHVGAQPTAEEMEGKPDGDIIEMERPIATACPPELLAEARAAADKGRKGFEAFWKPLTRERRLLLQHEIDALKLRTEEAEARLVAEALREGSSGEPTPEADRPIAAADPNPGKGGEDAFIADMDRAERAGAAAMDAPADAAPNAKGARSGKR